MGPRTVILGLAAVAAGLSDTTATDSRRDTERDSALRSRLTCQLERAAALLEVDGVPPLLRVAAGTVAADDVRVYYEPGWVRGVIEACAGVVEREDDVLLAVMAHALAHVQLDHKSATGTLAHGDDEERLADEWAAKALARAGATGDRADAVWKLVGEVCPGSTKRRPGAGQPA